MLLMLVRPKRMFLECGADRVNGAEGGLVADSTGEVHDVVRLRVEHDGAAKVDEAGVALVVDDDVLAADVVVGDVVRVDAVNGGDDLLEETTSDGLGQTAGHGGGRRPVRRSDTRQRKILVGVALVDVLVHVALEMLENEVEAAVCLHELKQLDDVWVVEMLQNHGLVEELIDVFGSVEGDGLESVARVGAAVIDGDDVRSCARAHFAD